MDLDAPVFFSLPSHLFVIRPQKMTPANEDESLGPRMDAS